MRLLSLFCYNPTISVDETTAHENIQGYYPPTVSLDEQTNEVGLCSAGVAIQDRFSACTGPITRTQLLHNQRPLVDRLLLDEETAPAGGKWPTSSAAQDAAASARALKIQRRSLTIGTKRFVIVPVEENFYIVAVLSRGHVSEATSLEGPHPRALRQRSGVSGRPSGDVRGSGAGESPTSSPSTIAGTTAQEIDAFAKSRNQTPSGYKRHISAVTHAEDDVDDAVVDGVESYIRSYHDMFAMMYGTLTRNYSKIVQPLTKPMIRAMGTDEERDAAKGRRSEQTARFRSMVKVGLVAKLVPRLRRWLLGSPSDGASFLSPVGMELLGVSGPAALAVSSISGVLQNAHPGALCGVVAMADGKVFHSTVSSKDTSTLFRLVEHYCTDALDSEHDRIVNLAAAGPDRLQAGGVSRRPRTEAIPYRSRRTGTLENPNSNNAPLYPPINPIDDTWLMDSKRMLQAESERAQCFRRSVHFGKPGHRLVGMAGIDGPGGGSAYTPPSSAPMAAPLMGSAQRSAKRSVGAFDMTLPSMSGEHLEGDGGNQATRSSGVLMEQTAPRGAYRFIDPSTAGTPPGSTPGHNPRDAFSAALLADDISEDEEDMTDRSGGGGGVRSGRSSTASSFVQVDRPPQLSAPTMGGGERAGSFVFVDGVPMGVINCELESIQLLLLVHEKFLSIPQLQAGLVQSVEEVLESVNGSDQLLSYIRPAVAASTNSNFSKEFNYHYVNTMNHSVKSSIKTQLNSRITMQLEEGINAGLQVLDTLGATGKKYQPSPQATSLIRSATLRATPLLSRTSDASPRSSGINGTVTPTMGGPPVEVSTSRQVQSSLLGPASAQSNPVLSAYFYELQTLLRTMPPPPRPTATTLLERQAASKLPRHASLLEVIPYTLHVSKPPHVFSETATLPLNQLDAIRNFIALQGSTTLTDGGRRGARQHHHSMPSVTLINATALSEDDVDDMEEHNSPNLAFGVENPLRDALARLGATTWCYYMAAEWREFCIVVEADSIITADRTVKSVVRAVFTGLHQDPL